MWSDGKFDYDFADTPKDEDVAPMPFYKTLLYRGNIRQFNLGTANKYSRQRNMMGKEFKKAHKEYARIIKK